MKFRKRQGSVLAEEFRVTFLTIGSIFLFGMGFQFSRMIEIDIHRVSASQSVDFLSSGFSSGPQLEMVFIGSPRCKWSNQPELPALINKIRSDLSILADSLGMSFNAVGIAVDWDPVAGLEYLAGIGQFNEMSSGGNWGNSMVLKHIWSDGSAVPSTPQLLVYSRDLRVPSVGGAWASFAEINREKVFGKVGFQAIKGWAENGSQVPRLTQVWD